MATELVDASKLDACCTAEANAIRAKTGSSAQIAYDWANSKGFADAIAAISGGGGEMQSGTITVATDILGNQNLIVPLSGSISNFVFYESTFPDAYDGTIGWETTGGVWLNNFCYCFNRYNNNNHTASPGRTVSATPTEISINVQYPIKAGATINWVGW